LARARQPRVEGLQKARATNEYWLMGLGGAQTDPGKLETIRETILRLQRVTPADIQAFARRYLKDERSWRMVVLPEKKPGQ
jgi:zinc protease